MAAIYLKHPVHGTKVACGRLEADSDISNGWEEYNPNQVVVVADAEDFVQNVLGARRSRKKNED